MEKRNEGMFKIVKRYFERGIYSDTNVAQFVKSRKITAEQYKEITGKDYK